MMRDRRHVPAPYSPPSGSFLYLPARAPDADTRHNVRRHRMRVRVRLLPRARLASLRQGARSTLQLASWPVAARLSLSRAQNDASADGMRRPAPRRVRSLPQQGRRLLQRPAGTGPLETWRRREHMEAALGGAASTVRAQTSPSTYSRQYARNATDTAEIAVSTVLDATLGAKGRAAAAAALLQAVARGGAAARRRRAARERVGDVEALDERRTTFWMAAAASSRRSTLTTATRSGGSARVIVSLLDDSEYPYPRSGRRCAAHSCIDLGAWLRGDATQRALSRWRAHGCMRRS